ncbi:MAG: ATP-binding cassette domain-containing protein [Bacteroidota bacterium]|nr:ATP-binding cassette domain-containing protein [Bacteroidota bacterium]
MARTKILQVSSLRKSFKKIQAVKDISFSLEQGDIFAFIGPNGAGKTTSMRILLDIIKADSGTITWNINGKECRLPPSSDIGYLPEERGLYADLPIIRSLVYLASIRGMNPSKANMAAMEWLERLELADRANEKLQTLSKGNQQKIQFVASILHKPTFAILDEPFSGLDPQNQEKFIEYIKELNEKGTTILLSSHQMPLVEKIAHKVFLMNSGEALFNGTLTDIYKNFGQQHIIDISFTNDIPHEKLHLLKYAENIAGIGENLVKVTFHPIAELKQILGNLAKIEGIANIKSHNSSLHDIFLKIVKEH